MPWNIADGDSVNSAYLKDLIENALGGGNPAQGASYVIFKSGSTYYARNGTDGTIDYSGTNAATVIQAAIDALSSGLVFLKGNASYVCTSALTQKAEIAIVGENRGTTFLDFSSGTSDGITTAAGNKRYLRISDLTIKMNDKVGILWQNVQESAIDRVRILNPSIGFKLSGNDGTASSSIHNHALGLIVDNPSDAGIRLTGVSGNGQANGNWIHCVIKNLQGGAPVASSIGVDLDVASENMLFAFIQQVDYGIRFDEATYNLCHFNPDRVTAFTDELTFLAGSSENTVWGENISSNITAGGTNNKVFDDITYYESAAAFANPSIGPVWSGRITLFEETGGGTTRLYWYDSAGWHYVSQTA